MANYQARRNNLGLPHPLRVRCAILKRFLKLGTEPTELMFAVMAEMPIDEVACLLKAMNLEIEDVGHRAGRPDGFMPEMK